MSLQDVLRPKWSLVRSPSCPAASWFIAPEILEMYTVDMIHAKLCGLVLTWRRRTVGPKAASLDPMTPVLMVIPHVRQPTFHCLIHSGLIVAFGGAKGTNPARPIRVFHPYVEEPALRTVIYLGAGMVTVRASRVPRTTIGNVEDLLVRPVRGKKTFPRYILARSSSEMRVLPCSLIPQRDAIRHSRGRRLKSTSQGRKGEGSE